MSALDDFRTFVTDAQAAAYYQKWTSQNAGASAKWVAFRDAILRGERPSAPDLGANAYGRALIDAGVACLNATAPTPGPTPDPAPAPAPTPTHSRYFADASPWNRGTAGATVRSDSASVISQLLSHVGACNFDLGDWTPLVYHAPAGTPRVRMVNPDGWTIDSAPDPAALHVGALPSDGWLVIIDDSNGLVYNLVYPVKQADGWHFGAAGVFRQNGHGCWDNAPGPWSGRAGGSCLLAGLITPDDAKAGVIPHALAMAMPKDVNWQEGVAPGSAVDPCRTSDGRSGFLKMGSWLQLNPTLDVSKLGLQSGEEMVAKAMQDYGVFVVDSTNPGSALAALYADNTRSPGGFAGEYPASWSDGFSNFKTAILANMRVLNPPTGVVYDSAASMGQPHR